MSDDSFLIALDRVDAPAKEVRIGDPVILKETRSFGFGARHWRVDCDLGILGYIEGDNASRLAFRAKAKGMPRGSVAELSPNLTLSIQFGGLGSQNDRPSNAVSGSKRPLPLTVLIPVLALMILGGILILNINWGGSQSPQQAQTDTTDQNSSTSPTPDAQAPAPAAHIPDDLAAFDKANSDAIAAYSAADNELKKSVVRRQRDAAAMTAVPGGTFSQWPSTLQTLGTDGDGDAYVVIKPDGCSCTLETTNNSFSNGIEAMEGHATLIKMGTDLFKKLEDMHEGDRVVVTGQFFREMSLTEEGSVTEPSWETVFVDISPMDSTLNSHAYVPPQTSPTADEAINPPPSLPAVPQAETAPAGSSDSDVMGPRFGNTVISRSANAEWHLYFRSDGTFSGRELHTNYSTSGSWELNNGDLCLSFQPPLPGSSNPNCKPISSHQVGDTWMSDRVTFQLAQGIQ